MATAALGTWRNPPLAYVVAELVISPYYSLAERVPGLQDRLRGNFPRTLEVKEFVVDGNKAAAQSMWQMLSADQRTGVHLGTRVISLHATSYLQSRDFLTSWAEVLDAVQQAELGAFVERAGLRYVDLIVPSNGRVPSDYLVDSLKGIIPEGGRCTGSLWAAAFQFDGSVVNLRAGAPSPQGMLLPPEFNALPLARPPVMLEAEARIKANQPIGFVDTDCIKEIGQLFAADVLLDHYEAMQKLASMTFKSALSNIAREEWV